MGLLDDDRSHCLKPNSSILWVDTARGQYARREIRDRDFVGQEFLSLMDKLRDVFLQDSAVLQSEFPESLLWDHAIFRHPDWQGLLAELLTVSASPTILVLVCLQQELRRRSPVFLLHRLMTIPLLKDNIPRIHKLILRPLNIIILCHNLHPHHPRLKDGGIPTHIYNAYRLQQDEYSRVLGD